MVCQAPGCSALSPCSDCFTRFVLILVRSMMRAGLHAFPPQVTAFFGVLGEEWQKEAQTVQVQSVAPEEQAPQIEPEPQQVSPEAQSEFIHEMERPTEAPQPMLVEEAQSPARPRRRSFRKRQQAEYEKEE